MLDGTLTLMLDGEETVIPAGKLFSIAPDVVHACWNASDAAVTFVVCYASPDFAACFDEIAALVIGGTNALPVVLPTGDDGLIRLQACPERSRRITVQIVFLPFSCGLHARACPACCWKMPAGVCA